MKSLIKAKILIIGLFLISTIFVGCGNNYDFYEEYVAKNNDKEIVYSIKNERVELFFRWMNKNITKGPYTLFLATTVKDKAIDKVYLDQVKIISSMGREYSFASAKDEPVLIYSKEKQGMHLTYYEDDSETDNVVFYEPPDIFDFKFYENEEFTLKFTLKYEGVNVEEKEYEIEYEPFLNKFYLPIV